MKNQVQKSGIKTWECACGAMNRAGTNECAVCGTAKPEAGNGKKLFGAAAKAVAQKTKAVAKKAVVKAERVIPKVTKAGAKVLGTKVVDGHECLIIQCIDCKKPRTIHFADAFQVKRCQACQEIFKASKRSGAAKPVAKNAKKK